MKNSINYGLIFCFIFIISCSKTTKKEEVKNPAETETASIKPPTNLISIPEAKTDIDNFNKTHFEEVGKEYAMRTWISLEQLKSYIAYIESESNKKNIPVSGIDFIYSQYESAEPGSRNIDNKRYKLTLMMAPTYEDSGKNIAFDPIYSTDGTPKDLSELLSNPPRVDTAGGNGAPPSSIGNRMNTCPSVCD
jgi:hypothetical protein